MEASDNVCSFAIKLLRRMWPAHNYLEYIYMVHTNSVPISQKIATLKLPICYELFTYTRTWGGGEKQSADITRGNAEGALMN